MVATEQADIGIATETMSRSDSLVTLPCYQWHHCVLVPKNHALRKIRKPLNLANLAANPIITYDFAFAGRSQLNQAFERKGLHPNVVLTALDSDVIKTYVRAGLGIGLLAEMAYDRKKDNDLHQIEVKHLFKANTTWVGIRQGSYMRRFVFDFIELFAPHLTRKKVLAALNVS